MLIHLLSRQSPGRLFRRLLSTALGTAWLLSSVAAQAQNTVWCLGTASQTVPVGNAFFPQGAAAGSQGIVPFNPTRSNSPQGLAVPISGLSAGQRLVGMDYRPNTGQLFALGYNAAASTSNARLYVLNPITGVATPVGSADFTTRTTFRALVR